MSTLFCSVASGVADSADSKVRQFSGRQSVILHWRRIPKSLIPANRQGSMIPRDRRLMYRRITVDPLFCRTLRECQAQGGLGDITARWQVSHLSVRNCAELHLSEPVRGLITLADPLLAHMVRLLTLHDGRLQASSSARFRKNWPAFHVCERNRTAAAVDGDTQLRSRQIKGFARSVNLERAGWFRSRYTID